VRVTVAEEGDRVLIDLFDDGPGMPTKALENLFRPFSGGARKGGAGLGLAIAHELTAMQGGRLELLSTTTAGTAFRIALPAARDVGANGADAPPAGQTRFVSEDRA
jgi:signal transduction histidine kinase